MNLQTRSAGLDLHFEAHLIEHPGRKDILAHYYLARGLWKLRMELPITAQTDLREALNIRTGRDYTRGWADALVALAAVDRKRGDIPSAIRNYAKALRTNPYSAARVILGA